tara:strand:+ start:9332 stop:9613 length:282 start_codon:yes stop_codon:yes gene_type:complete
MDLKKNYERLFGKIKPLKTESNFVMTADNKKKFNTISTNMARKYPNAPITLREGFVYLGYKKLESIENFLKRSSLNINETVRSFSISGKKGLV